MTLVERVLPRRREDVDGRVKPTAMTNILRRSEPHFFSVIRRRGHRSFTIAH